MKSVLVQLWNGDIYPRETPPKASKKEQKQIGIMINHRDSLYSSLDETQKAQLEKYDDLVNDYIDILSYEAFAKGFKLGARIILEALEK